MDEVSEVTRSGALEGPAKAVRLCICICIYVSV